MEKQGNCLFSAEEIVYQSSQENQNTQSDCVDGDNLIYYRIRWISSRNKFAAINLGRLGTILNILKQDSNPILILSVLSTHGYLTPSRVDVYNAASMIADNWNFQIYFDCSNCKTKITSDDLLFSRFINESVNTPIYTVNILEKLKCYHSNYCKANQNKLNQDLNFSLQEGILLRASSNSSINCMLLNFVITR